MSQQLDQLSNEELDALAATEIMEWHQENRDVWGGLLRGKTPWWCDSNNKPESKVEVWHPTAEGKEHQAMMVVKKMTVDRWDFNLFMPRDGDDRGSIAWFGRRDGVLTASDKTTGRAIVLAALKAKRVGDEPTRD